MPKKKSKKEDDKKLFAFLATFLSIVGFILALFSKKNDKYIMFYAKQSLIVFIVYVVAVVISAIPLVGVIVGPIVYLAATLFWVMSWLYALSGKKKEVPFIGQFAKNIEL